MASARGQIIAFLDNDVALRSRSWLTVLAGLLTEQPGVAAVGPKLVYPCPPYLIQCAGVGISDSGRVQFRGRGQQRNDPRFDHRQEVQCLISACMVVRKSVLDEVGGFDEEFNPVQYEDFDLCYRIRSRGYKAVYEPAAEMYHFESVTTAGTPTIPNTGVIIRHGLRFKKRWKHMFEKEGGPADSETAWRKLSLPDLSLLGDLPLTD
jgi:GT2 family glycosyltransferase